MRFNILCSIIFLAFQAGVVAQNNDYLERRNVIPKGTLVAEVNFIPLSHTRMVLEDGMSKSFKGHQTGSIGAEFFSSENKSFALLASMTTNSPLLIGTPECMDSICISLFVYSASLFRKLYWRGFSVGYGVNHSKFNYTRSEWDSSNSKRILAERTELTRGSFGAIILADYSTDIEKLFNTKDLRLGFGITFRPMMHVSSEWGWRYQHSASLDLKVRWVISN